MRYQAIPYFSLIRCGVKHRDTAYRFPVSLQKKNEELYLYMKKKESQRKDAEGGYDVITAILNWTGRCTNIRPDDNQLTYVHTRRSSALFKFLWVSQLIILHTIRMIYIHILYARLLQQSCNDAQWPITLAD